MNTPESKAETAQHDDAGERLQGATYIRTRLKSLPTKPGVYRMLDEKGEVLYVGKAKNLRNRVTSYAAGRGLHNRTMRMVSKTTDLVIVTTATESEALLLEAHLIKRYQPPFNVLLRDDKSFPYILIRTDHEWPQLMKHRGARRIKGHYFGPFASAGAVNQTLSALQRAFLLRSCSDGVFEARSRPCLLYQIKRCSAPCVERIGKDDYDTLVHDTRDFLKGRTPRIQRQLSDAMAGASEEREYERAAAIRDRIKALTNVQGRQGVVPASVEDADVFAAFQDGGQSCVQVFFFRAGLSWGNRAYFPRHDKAHSAEEVLEAFVGQFYDNKPPPKIVLLSHDIAGRPLLEEALSLRAERRVKVSRPKRGDKVKLIELAERNARDALALRLAESSSQRKMLAELAELFDLEAPPERIEAYDNSHISGSDALGAMIVCGPDGFAKNAYRKFNIKDETLAPGDDYGMMREVFRRRFARLVKEDPGRSGSQWPDLVLIDGGAGQLSAVQEVLAELGLEDVPLVAIAKGRERNAGRERFFTPGREAFSLEPNSPVLYFLQRIRDEVHRFVIVGHRGRRAKSMHRSLLEDVAGIGPKRKKALLNHFGSAKAVADAALQDLESADGISKTVAQKIYDHFHTDM